MTLWERLLEHGIKFSWRFGWTGDKEPEKVIVKFTAKSFYEQFQPYFETVAKRTGVPWEMIAAQAAVESNFGNSGLAQKDNNYFGLTAGSWIEKKRPVSNWPTKEQNEDGSWRVENRYFRHYATIAECMDDYAQVLMRLYPKAIAKAQAGNANGFFQELKNGGYASDKKYALTLARRYLDLKPQHTEEGLA